MADTCWLIGILARAPHVAIVEFVWVEARDLQGPISVPGKL